MTWLRRNRLPLVAVVVFAPLALFATAGLSLLDLGRTDPTPVTVANKVPHASLGATWKVRASREFPGTGRNGVPVGLSLVAALVDVTPVAGGSRTAHGFCTLTLQAPGPEGTRTWEPLDDPADYDYVRSPGTVSPGDCAVRPSARMTIEVVFLTPARTIDRSGIVVQESDRGQPVRFRLALHDD